MFRSVRERARLLAAVCAAAALLAATLIAVGPARGGVVVEPVNPAQPGVDRFPSGGRVNVTVTLPGRPATTEDIAVSSRGLPDAEVQRGALQNGMIPTEILAMRLNGSSPTLGPVIVTVGREFGLPPSRGEIRNVRTGANGAFAFGESFFDVFFEIFAPQSPIGPIQARNTQPLRMSEEIFDLPPNRPQRSPALAFAHDHMKCYSISRALVNTEALSPAQRRALTRGRLPSRTVRLLDQLEARPRERIGAPVLLCNPVAKVHAGARAPIRTSRNHLVCYRISERTAGLRSEALGVKGQFGSRTVDLRGRDTLCVPSSKRVLRGPRRVVAAPTVRRTPSHFKCYAVAARGTAPSFRPTLADQFEARTDTITGPTRLCDPVQKNRSAVPNPFAHLSCHPLPPRPVATRIVAIQNQFGIDFLTVRRRHSLCVPTHKTRCAEYAEQARVALTGPGGVPAGTLNSALHVPYERDPEGACP